jgi:hypothetical protein
MVATAGARRVAAGAAATAVMVGLAVAVCGCARYPLGSGPDNLPERVLIVTLTMKERVLDSDYYYFAIDTDGDDSDGPLPVVQGPFWGNGWGTGSMSYFVEYHAGIFGVYQPLVVASLVPESGNPGGILSVLGTPTNPVAGQHKLDVAAPVPGAVTIEGTGMVTAATNASQQAAGSLTLETDAAGALVADSVAFTPADLGGRNLTTAENQRIADLNAGGEALATDTFESLGLTLTLDPAAAATQTLTIAPTTAVVTDRFVDFFGSTEVVTTGSLYANETSEGPTPILPGVQFTTTDLSAATEVEVATQFDVTPDYVGPPFQNTAPGSGDLDTRQIGFVLDLAQIGDPSGRIDINVITTDEIITDPQILGPKDYDALGTIGNAYITIPTTNNYIYQNADATEPESIADCTSGNIDIADWEIEVRITGQ